MPTLFIDYENGNDNWGGSSFAPLASGTDGGISSIVSATYATFTSPSANFANNNTIAQTKNVAWYTNSLTSNGSSNNLTLAKTNIAPPSGIDSVVYSMIENTSSSSHHLASVTNYTPIYTSTQYTLSAYFKANGRNKILIRYDADVRMARYNLSNGTVEATGASATSNITSVGDGWYRLSLTITTPAGAGYSAENWQIMLEEDSYVDLTFASATYVGNGTSGVYICGLQIENSASPTTYEKPPEQCLSIFNGTSYISFYIAERINSTTLRINIISAGASLATQSSRQYFIGGRWKTISSTGASAARLIPGDTVRVMASPEPTIVGSGLWSTLTGWPGAGTSNITAATNTAPIRITCASSMATQGITNGSTVLITGNTANTNSNGTWTVVNVSGSSCDLVGSSGNFNQVSSNGLLRNMTHRVVTLGSPVTENIASYGNRGNGRTSWVASSNVTATLSTNDINTGDSKEGDSSDSIAIADAFTTGKAAYKPTGPLNLSSYQQLSFHIKQTAGTVATSGDLSLRLCSDVTGDTVVHTFNIPSIMALNFWIPFTLNLNSFMSNNIQSIALFVNTDRGAQTFLLSNIIACKSTSSPDSLNLQSLISKNVGDECWYPIMSINGTRIMITQGPNSNTNPSSTTNRGGYYGITENISTYKRETIKTIMVSTFSTIVQEVQEAGTAEAPFNYEFGWDHTNMSIRNSQTYFDGLNGLGYGLVLNTKNYVNINNVGFVRYDRGPRFSTSSFGNHGFIEANGNTSVGTELSFAQSYNTYNFISSCCNQGNGMAQDFGSSNNIYNKIITIGNLSNGFYGGRGVLDNIINNPLCATNTFGVFFDSSSNNIITSGNFIQNGSDGFRSYASSNDTFINCRTSGNSFNVNTGFFIFAGNIYLKNCIMNEPLEAGVYSGNGTIHSTNHDNINNNHYTFTFGGLIFPQTSIRYSNNGFAWSLNPTSTFRSSTNPLQLSICKIAVIPNSPVTIRAWMRRSNIGLTTGLRIKGGQIGGVPNDITSYMNATADIWQQVTLSFNPTEVGVVEILAECWGGTTFTAYIDDISITQT